MGSKKARTPRGNPEAEKMTTCGLPKSCDIVTPTSAVPPDPREVLVLSVERAKSLSMTDTVPAAVRVAVPAVAWTAKGSRRVRQLWVPSNGMYWAVYQNVQSSAGSTDMLL